MTTQSTQNASYFNLHTQGIGYLNNVREVTPKKGKPFLACRIAALTGDAKEPEYRYFDVNVVGEETANLIRRCQDAVNADKKVLISFVIADLWVDTFTYTTESKYHKKGDVGTMLKGRLIRIKSVKVDGELKYREAEKADSEKTQA
ncbi:STY4534 family ICE replication protein [Avibacterium sp. 21-599]|uniref:STY4534 family ICE replication protein n=1 Tax=Avibacterium sp. 21-599 TaxID=2911528 RepID=UPI0022467D92|nr:STY4534 family ICE replication protein [Avibacterium sp. 21-599]MCW9718566.1 STY4534 family ICE replication protein [Avibacterium sp. 21-599]